MRGGPAKPLGRAQPPPTKGFTSNLNVQTTQLSKGLAPAFCYCPVLSPEALRQKLEQAAQSESPWASGADKKPQRSVTQGRRPLLIANIGLCVPFTFMFHLLLSQDSIPGKGPSRDLPPDKKKSKQGRVTNKHRQFPLFPCPRVLTSMATAQAGLLPTTRTPWQRQELLCATLLTCQGIRGPSGSWEPGSLLSNSNTPCSAAPPHLYINSLDHLCIENKSVCFLRKACKTEG